ncbi:hypothetical protein GCM10009706_34230 [Curtobacterium citreum]|uniref:GNAT family N-acetyltransferase n=1 Tax=Curtobacterium citreum TaxID=2036 RepID=A0ABT2HM01_9MICO|nr:GNAT family N-acetyltransferase [Curtobacterium citreum]MCS6524300.1 GNAT family N-acetyltransferase [Curtobacterium citreum]TQJ29261.1 hypothetical protein FB462_3174 [Curtobacterium citreum]GGL92902.1 hypothetical protein GCM10009706_34230 [Curtobacterium citreum]
MTHLGDLFIDEPTAWGSRGDPWLWRELGDRFAGVALPARRGALAAAIRRAAADAIGAPLTSPDPASVFVERFAHGGMSSGMVSLAWWRETGLPVLLERAGFSGDAVRLRVTYEDDWAAVRDLRLRNASENPIAYGATFVTTLGMTEDDWRLRARRGTAADSTSVVAVAEDGRWLGMMACQSAVEGDVLLTGVYVEPDARGPVLGVADELLGEVLAWASMHGDRMRLWVDAGRGGTPARSFYARNEFHASGARQPLQDAFSGEQLEMVRRTAG